MNEEIRHEIVRRRQGGASIRRIASDLNVARDTVRSVIRRWEAGRAGQGSSAPATRRPSLVDPFHDTIKQLLERYPEITIQRVLEELRLKGFAGGRSIVRERVLELRPRPTREPVVRFETSPGQQAQMDYSTYDIDFTGEGRRRVHLFSYVLGYSRRQYLRFVEAQDLPTTLREHIRAFEHLGGVARTCLYDNMKVVVLRHGDEGPLYNPKFLAFATHYGFTPRACRVRRGQTKGKVERPFFYAEQSLLNGRTFRSLEHLNEVTAWWLANVADVRVHRETKQRPLDRHAEERPLLLPLPDAAYHVDAVCYRVVNVEGDVAYRANAYSVPWRYIGLALPVLASETELIIYGPTIDEVARHRLFPRGITGQRSVLPGHRPSAEPRQTEALLRERFAEFGPDAVRFLNGLLAGQRYGKNQAFKLLALLGTYTRVDWQAALERAVRYGAYSLNAVERILAAQAQPKNLLDIMADQDQCQLPPHLTDNPVAPRPATDYHCLLEETTDHEPPQENSTSRHDPDNPPAEDAGRSP
jgi:transposase